MKSISETNDQIKRLLEKAANLVATRDLNNVGMPWPEDGKIAAKIRKISDEI